jgi:hypothetical protein
MNLLYNQFRTRFIRYEKKTIENYLASEQISDDIIIYRKINFGKALRISIFNLLNLLDTDNIPIFIMVSINWNVYFY